MNKPPQNQASVTGINSQVEDLKDAMRENINKAMNRGIQLEQLDSKVEDLYINSNTFQKTSSKTKNKYKWENIKWTILLIAVISIILLVIILAITLSFKK